MREITVTQISSKIKELFLDANYHIGKDVLDALKEALKKREISGW